MIWHLMLAAVADCSVFSAIAFGWSEEGSSCSIIQNDTWHKNPGSIATTFYNKDVPHEGFPFQTKETHRGPIFQEGLVSFEVINFW